MRLKALRPMTYATRRLLPGDVFEAKSKRDHKVLLATRKVEAVRELAHMPAPPPELAKKIAEAVTPVPKPAPVEPIGAMVTNQMPGSADERAALRAEYEQVLGKAPFPGWSAEVLREKIAAASAVS